MEPNESDSPMITITLIDEKKSNSASKSNIKKSSLNRTFNGIFDAKFSHTLVRRK